MSLSGVSVRPEVLKSGRRQLGVAGRVPDILVAEVALDRPFVLAGISQLVAGGVADHVRTDLEGHFERVARCGTSIHTISSHALRVSNRNISLPLAYRKRVKATHPPIYSNKLLVSLVQLGGFEPPTS